MKKLAVLFAALLVAGCGEKEQSAPAPEAKTLEPVAEAELPTKSGPKSKAMKANLLKGKWIEFGDTVRGGPETWEFHENGTVDIIHEGKKMAGKYEVIPPDTVSMTAFGTTISAKISKSGDEITSSVGKYKKEGAYQAEAKIPPAETPVAEPPSEEPSETPNSLSDADVERLLKEAVDFDSLEERDDLHYQTNESEPYSGWVKMMYDSGQVKILGQSKDGKREGLFTEWHDNGQKKEEGTFKDGRWDGLWTFWHENGTKRAEVTYRDGKRDGLFTLWHENGQKRREVTFKDDEPDGLLTNWHPNGQKKSEETRKNGKKDGPFTWWHENGQKEAEGAYKDGQSDGLMKAWHDNGKKGYEVAYKDGMPDGLTTAWHENGQKRAEVAYKDGEEVSAKYWNGKGEEVATKEETDK